MGSRIAPQPRFNKHSDVISWFNELMITVKTLLHYGHKPTVQPQMLDKWLALRDTLYCTDDEQWIRTGNRNKLHRSAIDTINGLVIDLVLILEKKKPSRAVDEIRMRELDELYSNLTQCKVDRIYY